MSNKEKYTWTDNPTEVGVAECDPNVLNDCLMYLRNETVSNMYETGAVSNDKKGFEELLKRAHSTFDLSKFEVVGSPNITGDGVASGFSNSNYLKCKIDDLTFNQDDSIVVRGAFKLSDTTPNVLFHSNEGFANVIYAGSNRLVWQISGTPNVNVTLEVPFTLDRYYTLIAKYANKVLKVDVTDTVTGEVYTKSISVSVDFTHYIFRYIGAGAIGDSNYMKGSILLKEFSITLNDVPVFNGNKTGLYIAKSDNYEVVGSPTISEDGIASNFSSNNYIRKEINGDGSTIKICNKFLYQTGVTNDVYSLNAPNSSPRLICSSNLNFYYYDLSAVSSMNCPISNLTNGKWYFTEHYVSSTAQYAKIYDEDMNLVWEHSINVSIDIDVQQALSIIKLGHYDAIAPFNSSIDLSAFKIYVDEELIYQPCLQIPYSGSITGSKIVDAQYRSRVQDVYEQTGTAMYYTLDEENQNFTLPMGDIYGMIERAGTTRASDSASPSDKTETWSLKANNQTYEAPADGWFYISGLGSSTTQGFVLMFCEKTNLRIEAPCSSALGLNLSIRVKKGDVVKINYANYTNQKFGFTYTKGALNG